MTDGHAVISADRLSRSFGETLAVDEVSLSVGAGEVVGLLGPNGAGKTTMVRMLTTLLPPSSGTATIAGFDLATEPRRVRESIGLAGQAAAIDGKLTARENLDLFGRLYHLDKFLRRKRIEELIDRFRLTQFADRPADTYSGGERRRLDLVASLVADPVALFLDEPTTGLDPRSRAEIWSVVRDLAAAGTAVLLTTQYLEEADALADRMTLIDSGREVASGTSSELKRLIGGERLQLEFASAADLDLARAALPGAAFEIRSDGNTGSAVEAQVPVDDSRGALELLRELDLRGVPIEGFRMQSPTLDDVFLAFTEAEVTR